MTLIIESSIRWKPSDCVRWKEFGEDADCARLHGETSEGTDNAAFNRYP